MNRLLFLIFLICYLSRHASVAFTQRFSDVYQSSRWMTLPTKSMNHRAPHRNCAQRLLHMKPSSLEKEEGDTNENIHEISWKTLFDNPFLATLDFVSFLIFASVGKASHSSDGNLDILGIVWTALPFIFAWFVTSPLTGIYQSTIIADTKKEQLIESLKVTIQGWIVAIPLGCAIRGCIKGYIPPLPFVFVTMISTLVILGLLRGTYAMFTVNNDDTK